MLQELEERIAAYAKQVEQSIANHNFLVGAYNEAKAVLELYNKVHAVVPELVDAVPCLEEAAQVTQDILDVVQPAE